MLSDKIVKLSQWIAMPLVMMSMNHGKKYIRVMAHIASWTILLPLFIVGSCIFVVGVMVSGYEQI